MSEKQYVPIDLPRDLLGLMDGADEAVKKGLSKAIQDALEDGRWKSAQEFMFDPTDLEFGAYWFYKTKAPIKEAIKGSGVEEKLAPFKKVDFDLKPEGFQSEQEYTLSAVGDLMFAKYIEESRNRLYSNVEDLIFGSEYAFANLESTLSPEAPKGFDIKKEGDTPQINITKGQYDALIRHQDKNYDVVNLTNNHILDCGAPGIEITIDQLKKDNIAYLGVYESEEKSKEVTYTMLDDIKIGWVSHTFSVNGKPFPEDKPWICEMTPFHLVKDPDTKRMEKQIKDAKQAGCDLVFLSLHWGLEHEFFPHPDQLKWAHKFADLGADAIIAHHPHVIQPVEIYHPEGNGEKSVPILYSLGNLTPAYGSAATVLSLVARLNIAKGTCHGEKKTVITGLNITPVAFMGEKEKDKNYASIVPLSKLNKMDLDSETREYVKEINECADLVIGKDWR